MDWGPYLDGVVVIRTVFADDERVAALGEAVGQDDPPPEVAPYVPRAWPCDRQLFEEAGWRGCAERYVPPALE